MLFLLSSDVLAAITSRLEGLHIGRLWQCGNSGLNARLSSRGVLDFHLFLDPLYPISWPSLIRHLPCLETFEVTNRFKEFDFQAWKPCFADFSRSVKKLSFHFDSDTEGFFKYLATAPDAFPNLECISDTPIALDERYLELLHHCPRLSIIRVPFHVDTFAPADLPRHLVYMDVTVATIDISKGLLFPSALETLHFECFDFTFAQEVVSRTAFFSSLPTGLQSLNFKTTAGAGFLGADDVASMPRGLQTLQIPAEPSIALLKALPPQVTDLSLLYGTKSSFTEKYVLFWDQEGNAAIALLPKSITKLKAQIPPPQNEEDIPFYPPNLTELPISISSALAVHFAHATAASLTGGVSSEKKLSDSVTSIVAHSADYYAQHGFPPALTHLHILRLCSWHFSGTLKLPPTLESLIIGAYSSLKLPLSQLPHHLTKLIIVEYMPEMGPPEFESLPRTLKILTLKTEVIITSPILALSLMPPHIEELHLSAFLFEVGGMSAIPSSKLRTLRIDFSQGDDVSNDILRTLPRKLASLVLSDTTPGITTITDDSLRNLPPGLARLEFIHAPEHITGSCKPHLPKSLISLVIGEDTPPWFGGDL